MGKDEILAAIEEMRFNGVQIAKDISDNDPEMNGAMAKMAMQQVENLCNMLRLAATTKGPASLG